MTVLPAVIIIACFILSNWWWWQAGVYRGRTLEIRERTRKELDAVMGISSRPPI